LIDERLKDVKEWGEVGLGYTKQLVSITKKYIKEFKEGSSVE
jgi:hypothetical protein